MRRLIVLAALLVCAGCGGDLLGPVMTCDGNWSGTQNGYNLSLNMTQTDSSVSGTSQLTGNFGYVQGSVSGSCVYPNVNLIIVVPSFDEVLYSGTLSQTSATITGRLNGSGFTNLEVDIHKQ
ncbi:MAG TPA: hypothetical protein VHV78_14290 [Gemmatimonadaceae bacterium]|jgi:hypothetical protein|nr:hypothetical protein [Gemmatimonadaceae bacterium]